MPSNEIHVLIDIIAFGYEYGWLHKAKDYPSQYLGRLHRKYHHYNDKEWLQKLEKLGNKPRDKEVRQSNRGHDLIDKTWSGLSVKEKLGWAEDFKYVALHPELYPNLFMPEDYNQVLMSEGFIILQKRFVELSPNYLAGV